MSKRQGLIDNQIQDLSGENRQLFNKPAIQEELEDILKDIYKYQDMNHWVAEKVGEVAKKYEAIDRLSQLSSRMKVMKANLKDLNQFLSVFEIVSALKKIETNKAQLKDGGFERLL